MRRRPGGPLPVPDRPAPAESPEAAGPVLVAPLFAGLAAELVRLLRGLAPADWDRATSAGAWTVRDVAAHLLDGDLRRISVSRDGHVPAPPSPIRGYGDLLAYLNRQNAAWVEAARRLSPALLTELLEYTGGRIAELMESQEPDAPAPFGVAWAGRDPAPAWLDVGREYTERWHHQDQIREAVGAAPLDGTRWLAPVVDISLHVLPHAYRETPARTGDAVAIHVHGEAGGRWALVHDDGAWTLLRGEPPAPRCRIAIDALAAARLLLHRLAEGAIADAVAVEGEARLAEPFLSARAVMV